MGAGRLGPAIFVRPLSPARAFQAPVTRSALGRTAPGGNRKSLTGLNTLTTSVAHAGPNSACVSSPASWEARSGSWWPPGATWSRPLDTYATVTAVTLTSTQRRAAFREFRALPRHDRAAIVRAARHGRSWGDTHTQAIAQHWATAITSRKESTWLVFAVTAIGSSVLSVVTHSWWLLAPAVIEAAASAGSRRTWTTARHILTTNSTKANSNDHAPEADLRHPQTPPKIDTLTAGTTKPPHQP